MKILIGNTGLVGQVLKDKIQFDYEFNSKNLNQENFDKIEEGCDLYLSCLPATKWMVNKDVVGDIENIMKIYNIIKAKEYRKIVLISTIDVYVDSPLRSDEDFAPTFRTLNYGSNRYFFEMLVKEMNCTDIQIYRLPALFCNRIKKNILFDLLHNNNVDKINPNTEFQWYNLDRLVEDISNLDKPGTWNLFPEPIHTKEILRIFNMNEDQFESTGNSLTYNYNTKYSETGYTQSKAEVLEELIRFVNEFRNNTTSI